MDPITDISGDYLTVLLDTLTHYQDRIYNLAIAFDGGVKFKINEGTWTPAYGTVRPPADGLCHCHQPPHAPGGCHACTARPMTATSMPLAEADAETRQMAAAEAADYDPGDPTQ